MILIKHFKKIAQWQISSGPALLMLVIFSVYLAFGWYLATRIYKLSNSKTSLSYGQNFSTPNIYHNLDLRVAQTAAYQGSAITKIKSLGTTNGVKREIISFGVPADMLSEYGLMSWPTSRMPASGYPVIVLCHAYYNPAFYNTKIGYAGDMNFYSQHGFVVIKPDYRGQGLSRKIGQPESAYYSMAYNIDVMSLIAAVKATPGLNPRAINLWGHSMGAYIALRAAVLSKDVRSVVLLSGPVGKFDEMYSDYKARSDLSNPVAAAIRTKELLAHGTPLTNPNYWRNVSPVNFLGNSNAKFQIHSGTADKVVPPRFSAELDMELTVHGKAHTYFTYAGARHSLARQRPSIWNRSLQILVRN